MSLGLMKVSMSLRRTTPLRNRGVGTGETRRGQGRTRRVEKPVNGSLLVLSIRELYVVNVDD